jgi:tellurite resistance protein TerC
MNEPVLLFPFGEYWWFYAAFLALVLVLLSLDLGVFHRRAHAVSFKEAATVDGGVDRVSPWPFLGGFYLFMLHRLPLDPRLTAIAGFDPAWPRIRPPGVPGRLRRRVLALRRTTSSCSWWC